MMQLKSTTATIQSANDGNKVEDMMTKMIEIEQNSKNNS